MIKLRYLVKIVGDFRNMWTCLDHTPTTTWSEIMQFAARKARARGKVKFFDVLHDATPFRTTDQRSTSAQQQTLPGTW